jgi:RNA polymerase sigma-32 factor
MTNALELRLTLPAGSIDSYINSVAKVPFLTHEEERDLAERFRRDNDLDAARRLVMSHLRFVVRVARGYAGYGLPHADLIQEGNIGLMKAVKRFDPAVGVRLVSFAVHWIRAEIHEYILRNWRIVKVATTKAQRKLFFNLRTAKKRLGWLNQREVNEVAADLGVAPEVVVEMEARLSAHDASFDPANDADDDTASTAPSEYLADTRFEPSAIAESTELVNDRETSLHKALATLDQRSREIVMRRWLVDDKATLQELADDYEISAERIRQIEKNAFKKIKAALGHTAYVSGARADPESKKRSGRGSVTIGRRWWAPYPTRPCLGLRYCVGTVQQFHAFGQT